jgi:hypothetical protein
MIAQLAENLESNNDACEAMRVHRLITDEVSRN